MPKFLVYWEMEPTLVLPDREEELKGWLSGLEAVKADMRAGLVKDFGMFAGGMSGYGVWEVASEAELFTHLLKWMPGVNMEVKPVLTVDQCIEAIKKASQK